MSKYKNLPKELDFYDREILSELIKIGYEKDKALKVFDDYYKIMELLGWDKSPENWAKHLHKIISNDITPEMWMNHIKKCERIPLDPWGE